jgi:hypothetical protein
MEWLDDCTRLVLGMLRDSLLHDCCGDSLPVPCRSRFDTIGYMRKLHAGRIQ